jgi:hypothetical protein
MNILNPDQMSSALKVLCMSLEERTRERDAIPFYGPDLETKKIIFGQNSKNTLNF